MTQRSIQIPSKESKIRSRSSAATHLLLAQLGLPCSRQSAKVLRSKVTCGLESAQLRFAHVPRGTTFQLEALWHILELMVTFVNRRSMNEKVLCARTRRWRLDMILGVGPDHRRIFDCAVPPTSQSLAMGTGFVPLAAGHLLGGYGPPCISLSAQSGPAQAPLSSGGLESQLGPGRMGCMAFRSSRHHVGCSQGSYVLRPNRYRRWRLMPQLAVPMRRPLRRLAKPITFHYRFAVEGPRAKYPSHAVEHSHHLLPGCRGVCAPSFAVESVWRTLVRRREILADSSD